MMRGRRPLRDRRGMRASIRGVAFRPVWAVAAAGLRVEDELRRMAARLLAQAVHEALVRTLRGELVDVFAREVARYQVVERVSEPLLAGPALERVLEQLDTAAVPQRIAERLLADGIAEQVAARVLAGPELPRLVELLLESPDAERLLAEALASPGVERMLTQIVESSVVDATVARVIDETAVRLPRSEAVWMLVDEIAASPAVTDAITQQSVGFADEMAGRVRERSKTADARLERLARGLLRRRARDADPGPTTTPAT
jgi:hypothetical protein